MAKNQTSRSRQWWSELHREWETSGQSIVDFCRARGVRFQSFYNWRTKFKQAGLSSESKSLCKLDIPQGTGSGGSVSVNKLSFMEISTSPASETPSGITLESPTGWRIQMSSGNTMEALHSAVRLLEELR